MSKFTQNICGALYRICPQPLCSASTNSPDTIYDGPLALCKCRRPIQRLVVAIICVLYRTNSTGYLPHFTYWLPSCICWLVNDLQKIDCYTDDANDSVDSCVVWKTKEATRRTYSLNFQECCLKAVLEANMCVACTHFVGTNASGTGEVCL